MGCRIWVQSKRSYSALSIVRNMTFKIRSLVCAERGRLYIFFCAHATISLSWTESNTAALLSQSSNALKGMQTQYANAVNDLANNQRNFAKQRDNYLLAEDIYKVTSDRYREGIASMTEVLQDEMSMSDAQNNYLTAHFNYQVSNLTILKLTGRLDRLMK